jgi:hypothetical protein
VVFLIDEYHLDASSLPQNHFADERRSVATLLERREPPVVRMIRKTSRKGSCMPEDATHKYLLKVERLKELLVTRANGGAPDEKEYADLRLRAFQHGIVPVHLAV